MGVHSVVPAVISSQQHHQQHHDHPPVMFPPADSNDQQDRSNLPWGGRKRGTKSPTASPRPRLGNAHDSPSMMSRSEIKASLEADRVTVDPVKKKKKLWDLIALTISMAGAQVVWTVELGCVSHYIVGAWTEIPASLLLDTGHHFFWASVSRSRSPAWFGLPVPLAVSLLSP